MSYPYRIGVDENGLGARLGPLVVTAVLSKVEESRPDVLARRLPSRVRQDLDDSKRLVAHGDVALGEAWARAVVPATPATPGELFEQLSLEGSARLRAPCPRRAEPQCWSANGESFQSDDEAVKRMRRHLAWLEKRGTRVLAVKCSVLCAKALNDARARGHNRFVADLHAMERLILALRERAAGEVLAVCGKVGGIGRYSRFFGPLSSRLHTILDEGPARSEYRFPALGEIHFVRDADGQDPLVMLASLVGKYVRELLMERISRFYHWGQDGTTHASGYHDPVTARFVSETALVRRKLRIPDTCFERARASPAETT